MSIDRCSRCGDLVDTDNEPEAYVEVGNMRAQTETKCFCQRCRERYEEEQEDRATDPPDREFSPAQQAIIDAHEACGPNAMSLSNLDKIPLRSEAQARADRAKAQRARACLDCPGVMSLLCCGRARQEIPQEPRP